MKIALLYNQVSDEASADERDVLVQRDVVAAACQRLGHSVVTVPCSLDLSNVKRELVQACPDLVFNLVESLDGTDRLMPVATLLLDSLHLPYTGAATQSMVVTSDKLVAKQWLRSHQLPTPDWTTANGVGHAENESELEGRVIVKAIWEHASYRMDRDAVCETQRNAVNQELTQILAERSTAWSRPLFAERFIDGREFNLSLLAGAQGPEVLPPAEIEFTNFPEHEPRIVGYRAKWDEASFEYQQTPRRFEFPPVDGPLLAQLRKLATDCWHVFGLRGYARVDFRVDQASRPWILEVNVNPCLSPDAGFAAAIEAAGIPYDRAIGRILKASLVRCHS